MVVEKAYGWASPNDPVAIVLQAPVRWAPVVLSRDRNSRTSFFVTGLSTSTRCVRRAIFANISRSASSATLFDARTRFFRFGMDFAIVGWILATRFRASSSVVIRGDRGKLPRTWISLSVKSIES